MLFSGHPQKLTKITSILLSISTSSQTENIIRLMVPHLVSVFSIYSYCTLYITHFIQITTGLSFLKLLTSAKLSCIYYTDVHDN